jgi:6-phosphogluconolactonase (cycloisomerase 2 family)
MNPRTRVASAAAATTFAAAALALLGAAPASAAPAPPGAGHVVFVQTDGLSGNAVVAYDRAADGTLTLAGTYPTGGLGGALTGSVVDHLASQGSLTYDSNHRELYAVNAGSDTVSVFGVDGDRLSLRQVVGSGGSFPVSVTVHDDLVYVLNARDGGSIQGFRNAAGNLVRIPPWHRPLGLDPNAAPEFTHTPGQVAFTPDGSELLVLTKAGSNAIDVFAVARSGRPTDTPVVTSLPGTVPFGVAFDRAGHAAVAEAGGSFLATFALNDDGTLTAIDTVATGQAATCWVTGAGRFLYTGNAGSASQSAFSSDSTGDLTQLGTFATDAGTVDAAATPDGTYLYTQTGANGIVDEFAVGANGSLTALGSVTVPGAVGGEGIVAR